MDNNETLKLLSRRISAAKGRLLLRHPFFGRLLLHLGVAFGDCGTACTDGQRIIFDPDFAQTLDDGELDFVLLHELMHCVLDHFSRKKHREKERFNIAADIVVNSMILEVLGLEEFSLQGNPVMHLAPNGREGRLHSAEEVYEMLGSESLEKRIAAALPDTHETWPEDDGAVVADRWDSHVREAAGKLGANARLPPCLRRLLKERPSLPGADWRQLLQAVIRCCRSDYTFFPTDRRFPGPFLLPSFQENIYGTKAEKIWFCVDTSGSVSDAALTAAYEEICRAVEQTGSLSGYLSCFDTDVTEPVPFETVEDILDHAPTGGGGTSFEAVFQGLSRFDEMPKAMVILTDGYAPFPKEEAARGVSVIWLMVNSAVEPPWGAWACVKL